MRLLSFLLLSWLSVVASADILDLFSNRTGFGGDFVQQTIGAGGEVLGEIHGEFKLLKPHFLYWGMNSPDSQLVLAVDDCITYIDWDLEVITRREITPNQRGPFAWIMAPRSDVEKEFDILSKDDGLVLSPKNMKMGFKSLFAKRLAEGFWRFEAVDQVDQMLRIEFTISKEIVPEANDFDVPDVKFDKMVIPGSLP